MKKYGKIVLLLSIFMLFTFSITVFGAVPEGWGKGWSDTIILGKASQYSPAPDVMLDDKGFFYVIWLDREKNNNQIWYLKADDQGQVLAKSKLIQESEWKIRNFKTLMDKNNKIHIFLETIKNGEFQIRHLNFNPVTGAVEPEKILLEFNRPIKGLNGQIDHEGNIHLLWADLRLSNYEIFYSKFSSDLVQLIPPIPVTDTEEVSIIPNLAIDSKNRIHLIWNEYDGAVWRLKYQVLSKEGKQVSDVINIGRSIEYPNYNLPQIGVDTKDRVYIVWIKNDGGGYGVVNYELFYSLLDRDQKFIVREKKISNHGRSYATALSPTLYIDDEDKVHVVWSDNLYGPMVNLYAVFKDNNILHPQSRLAVISKNMWLPNFKIDQKGRKHLFYMEFEEEGRYNLSYMNTINPAKIVYFNRLGLDIKNFFATFIYRLISIGFFSALAIIMNFIPLSVAFIIIVCLERWIKGVHWVFKFLLMVSIILAFSNTIFAAFPDEFSSLYELLVIGISIIIVLLIGRFIQFNFNDGMTFVLLEIMWLYSYVFLMLIPAGSKLLR
ncbi:hypothetical protein BBF96_10070 [Anoxybacter fermentans]|uniref:Uncharacterized protein n=1 Tax=Anoxybacter fermentans TaxID=1323375 RepID=A0A3Q9HSU5_9FIRM|nr:hypothetical protein [Anoxybacter fermentans]AZR73698.1 hypothetical protein BBF96_10070 [Anoxybacter fermentans]